MHQQSTAGADEADDRAVLHLHLAALQAVRLAVPLGREEPRLPWPDGRCPGGGDGVVPTQAGVTNFALFGTFSVCGRNSVNFAS